MYLRPQRFEPLGAFSGLCIALFSTAKHLTRTMDA
jgi:hypothetical protein